MPAMRRRLLMIYTSVAMFAALMVVAPAALAVGGEGLLGETNDSTVTEAGFILIIFFPLFIGFASLLQAHLEKRKHARDDARKARETSADWRGGW
jgi:peptidoglycan biosynthesis protein MviN/MurJ (putative lipid II flippase)